MSIEYYTVEKKENDLIIHSAMETWKYTIIRNFIVLCPFSKISHPPRFKASYATGCTIKGEVRNMFFCKYSLFGIHSKFKRETFIYLVSSSFQRLF